METINVLKNADDDFIQTIVDQLNELGIVCDEDDTGISSTMIENWCTKCDEFLITNGYNGGAISTVGNFYTGLGGIYAIYDVDTYDRESAQAFMKKLALSKM